jgi:hypothetical protein
MGAVTAKIPAAQNSLNWDMFRLLAWQQVSNLSITPAGTSDDPVLADL